MTERYRTF